MGDELSPLHRSRHLIFAALVAFACLLLSLPFFVFALSLASSKLIRSRKQGKPKNNLSKREKKLFHNFLNFYTQSVQFHQSKLYYYHSSTFYHSNIFSLPMIFLFYFFHFGNKNLKNPEILTDDDFFFPQLFFHFGNKIILKFL